MEKSIKNLFLILILTFAVVCNANDKTNSTKEKAEYNLQNIFVQNYDFTATNTIIANNVKKNWSSQTRIKSKELILNNILSTKIENKDIEDGITSEIENAWYDQGVLIKYNDSKINYEITPGTKYKVMSKNANIGDKGFFPDLYSKNGDKIRTSWALEKRNNQTIYTEKTKLYSKNDIAEVIESAYIINNDGKILNFTFNYYFGDKFIHLVTTKSKKITYK